MRKFGILEIKRSGSIENTNENVRKPNMGWFAIEKVQGIPDTIFFNKRINSKFMKKSNYFPILKQKKQKVQI